jgi:integrase
VNKLVKDNTKKGVLSSSEIHALCSTPWDDERVKAAALLSLLCGLRLGEILGLQKDSIAEDRLTVRDSYGKKDGLKTTKNGKSRIVYLPSIIKLMLQQLIDTNPHNDAWVFWSEKAGVPINIRTVEKAFYIQLGKIGIFDANSSQEQKKQGATRQDRNITFHSLRHLYNTLLRGAIPDEILRESTGHLTASMTERYDHADHDSRIRALEVAVNERILTIIDA